MYVPPAFAEKDEDVIASIIQGARLCQFVTATPEGPLATPIPMLLAKNEGQYGTLYGHLARANLHWKAPVIGDALALFMGLDAYISPSWYASKQQHGKVVPTWNYEAVQAYGPVEFFEEPERLLDVVTRLTDKHESGRSSQWAVSDAPADYIQRELRGVIGLRMPITRLTGVRKLGQHKSAADKAGVAAGLAQSEREDEREMGAQIRNL